MRQYKEIFHRLEKRYLVAGVWTSWMPTNNGGFLRRAEMLAYGGQFMEALEEAQRVHLASAQCDTPTEFRVMSRESTVTAATALHDGWNAIWHVNESA